MYAGRQVEGRLVSGKEPFFSFTLLSRYSLNRVHKIRSIYKEIKATGSFISII
ncbi:MAG: hypothetical protein U9O59_02575 [Actinomycetota bacterium]|nr:hypothetical protein [Actinomycetota bacterium]